MTPGQLLQALGDREIRLYIEGAFLRYRGPVGAFDSALRGVTREYRQTLMTEWTCQRCDQIDAVFYGFAPIRLCRPCFEKGE